MLFDLALSSDTHHSSNIRLRSRENLLKVKQTNEPITDSWGCRDFIEKFNLNAIPEGEAEQYGTIDDLAGGLISKDHVPLQCKEHP